MGYLFGSGWKGPDKQQNTGPLPWKDAELSTEDDGKADEDDDSCEYALVPAMTELQKKSYLARGKTWQEMMEVYQDAPEDMRDIVDHLEKPCDPEWRAAFVVGPPGTGKTTATLAVPHLAQWYWKFLSGPALAGQYRNEAKERLASELQGVMAQRRKTVLIIDELNRLLENFDSESHDTDTTGSFLWTFLDEQRRNANFFFIGIMNRDDKIPDQVKHRLGGSTIFFPAITDPNKLREIFRKVVARNPAIAFDEECNDEFIDRCFSSLKKEGISLTPRDYENVRLQIARLTRRDDKVSSVRKIKQAHVTKAVYEVAKTYDRSGLGREHLNAEEWRDFNAVQSRVLEVRLSTSQTMQKSFGVTGIIPVFNLGGGSRFNETKASQIIEQEFTRDQITLYRRVMKLEPKDHLLTRET